jgi:hypothetical protein
MRTNAARSPLLLCAALGGADLRLRRPRPEGGQLAATIRPRPLVHRLEFTGEAYENLGEAEP